MLLHGSCAARDGEAVLVLGPPGSGKSDLLLRLLDRAGWSLVADDQVEVSVSEDGSLHAAPAPALRGMLEVRGLGLFAALPVTAPACLRLAVALAAARAAVPRLPDPARFDSPAGGRPLPRIALHAFDASAPAKVEWALDAALGRARMQAGAFA
jgi:HPr kinase/phosphorylase